jgi:hypothetical protein
MGEWENGRMGEWENGRMGEWENGRMGEWENGFPLPNFVTHERGFSTLLSTLQLPFTTRGLLLFRFRADCITAPFPCSQCEALVPHNLRAQFNLCSLGWVEITVKRTLIHQLAVHPRKVSVSKASGLKRPCLRAILNRWTIVRCACRLPVVLLRGVSSGMASSSRRCE